MIGGSIRRDRRASLIGWIAVAAWIGLDAVLLASSRWPGACNPHAGPRRSMLMRDYICSGHLLHGGWIEKGLFAYLWALPLLLVLLGLYMVLTSFRARR